MSICLQAYSASFLLLASLEKRRSNSYNNSLNECENYASTRRIMIAAMPLHSERAKKPTVLKKEKQTLDFGPLVCR
jgi:hypothetical protein